jgi:hypothetical protein
MGTKIETTDYATLTVAELRNQATERELGAVSGLRKGQLVQVLTEADALNAKKTKKAARKAPADAQAASDPGMAKAERFAAAAAEFGWTHKVRQASDKGIVQVVVDGPNGAQIQLQWIDGVYDRPAAMYRRSSADTKPVGVLNASAGRKIIAANPVKATPAKRARAPKAAPAA